MQKIEIKFGLKIMNVERTLKMDETLGMRNQVPVSCSSG